LTPAGNGRWHCGMFPRILCSFVQNEVFSPITYFVKRRSLNRPKCMSCRHQQLLTEGIHDLACLDYFFCTSGEAQMAFLGCMRMFEDTSRPLVGFLMCAILIAMRNPQHSRSVVGPCQSTTQTPVCQSKALARGAGQGDACSRAVSFRSGKAHDCDSKRRLPEAKTSDKRRHATGVGVWEQPTGSQVLWRLDDEVKHSC
jgi:hypothetical protein